MDRRAHTPDDRAPVAGILLLLAAAVVGVFGWTTRQGFLNYDDDLYVTENPLVRQGLSAEGVARAFGTVHSLTWHPLTTLSHMLDYQLFGLDPAGHHATSVLLHALTAMALFLVLRRLTGAAWRSALVAFLFAVHPLRVESVAWVSERKDVLSGLFFVLTLGAYARHVASERFAPGRYLLVVLCFALGLMAKPMVATLPFVLLLLDFWPLRRLGEEGAPLCHLGPRVLEKLPLLALSIAAGVLTLATQQAAMTSAETLGLGARVANAVVSYGVYLRQLFLPIGLAAIYPHPRDGLPAGQVALAALVLVGVTVLALRQARNRPALLVGWLWYLGMLVPVIGLVQVGIQAHADRYTYLPHIGLLVMLFWGFAGTTPAVAGTMPAVAGTMPAVAGTMPAVAGASKKAFGLGTAAVLVLALLAWRQVGFWDTPETLWRHTLAVTENNSVAHSQLGDALYSERKIDEAVEQYQAALAIQPDYATPHYNLGNVHAVRGELDEAIAQFHAAIAARPDYAKAYNNLGSALLRRRDLDEAVAALREAVRIDPDYAAAHGNLAVALGRSGQIPPAIEHLRRAAELEPGVAMRFYDLGGALKQAGDLEGSRVAYQRALELAEASGDSTLTNITRSRLESLATPPAPAATPPR